MEANLCAIPAHGFGTKVSNPMIPLFAVSAGLATRGEVGGDSHAEVKSRGDDRSPR